MATRRLLIVGDPALSRGLMKMVLSRLGYVVTCVVTGQEALIALSHSSFALALIALHLPDLPGPDPGAPPAPGTPAPVGTMPIIMFGDAWDPERILDELPRGGARRLPAQADLDRPAGLLDPRPHPPPAGRARSAARPCPSRRRSSWSA